MEEKFLHTYSLILGVSEESLKSMDKYLLFMEQEFAATFENADFSEFSGRENLVAELHKIFNHYCTISVLDEIAVVAGISDEIMAVLDDEAKERIVKAYMMDGITSMELYEEFERLLKVIDLKNAAKLLDVSYADLKKLPREKQERISDMYASEYNPKTKNSKLKAALNALLVVA